MTNSIILTTWAVLTFSVLTVGCNNQNQGATPPADQSVSQPTTSSQPHESEEASAMSDKIEKTEIEWQSQLTPEQFHVTREKGTEPAFTGKYWDHKGDGVYRCVCCGLELFSSDTKYKSGTGWPSFWQPVNNANVEEKSDTSYGMVRTELECSRCGAHLGHVFDDGPKPTGQRYCINSASLNFDGEESEKKDAEATSGE